jgi:molybdopterin converting factor subunit 1
VRLQVLYFASAREAAGTASEDVTVPDGATVESLRSALVERHPRLAGNAGALRFAVDERFATPSQRLEDGAVVALIPPVSGG